MDGSHWVYVDLPRWATPILGGTAGRAYFLLWQVAAARKLRRLRPEIVHLVTYASDAVPPAALVLAGEGSVRIWGPLGSAHAPTAHRRPAVIALSLWKKLVLRLAAPWVDHLLVQSPHVLQRVPRRYKHADVMPNVIVDVASESTVPGALRQFSTQLLVAGQLVQGKRPDLAIQVLTELPADVGLVVVGDGPLMADLQAQVTTLGLERRVTFTGLVPRGQALDLMRNSDALLHPSEHEGAPWVVGEAIALGLPVVVRQGAGGDSLLERSAAAGAIFARDQDMTLAVRAALSTESPGPSEFFSRDRWAASVASLYERTRT